MSKMLTRCEPHERAGIAKEPYQNGRYTTIPIAVWQFLRMAAVLICLLSVGMVVYPQSRRYSDGRALVAQVQDDLRRAADLARQKGKERERCEKAQKHLSEFDRSLSKGKFNTGRLDAAIDDVKNVVDHNTLSPQDRDELNVDLQNLRDFRARRRR